MVNFFIKEVYMKKTLDFIFVSGPLGMHLTGGDNVMLQLAHMLKDDGYKVGILFVPKIERYFTENLSDYLTYKFYLDSLALRYKIFGLAFHNKLGMKLLWIKRKIRGELEGIPSMTGISIFFQRIPENVSSKRAIAVGWRSAYVVNKLSYKCNKYYLVQHDEDNISYSGTLSELASKTYSFDFRKIVYNHHLTERFSNSDLITIKLGLIWQPKIYTSPEEKKNGNVLIVLREGASKGSKYAIKAASELSMHEGISFKSFGDYSGDIPKFIKHYGWVNKDILSRLYNWASIFVMPSIIEGFSLTTAEAMYAGCAIVGSDCLGIKEIIRDEINGFIVPPKRPEIMADRILELIRNDKIRLSFANKSKNDILDFTIGKTYQEFKNKILLSELNSNNSDQ